MCVPLCEKKMTDAVLNRRNFLKATGVATAGAAAAVSASFMTTPISAKEALFKPMDITISKVVDLTHQLTPEFPTYEGEPQLTIKEVTTLAKDGYNIHGYDITNEHFGTHLDAPFHFSDKDSADMIPVQNLVGPLCVIDITDKAKKDPDTLLTADDIKRWEKRYGRIPFGGIVAMNSGWDQYATGPKFRNADDKKVMHFPGFSLDAVQFLISNRQVKGIVVDTLSLDNGPSTQFDVHFNWLPSNRWGLECAANLGQLPARGATVVVGGPKYKGATGGPSRVIALV